MIPQGKWIKNPPCPYLDGLFFIFDLFLRHSSPPQLSPLFPADPSFWSLFFFFFLYFSSVRIFLSKPTVSRPICSPKALPSPPLSLPVVLGWIKKAEKKQKKEKSMKIKKPAPQLRGSTLWYWIGTYWHSNFGHWKYVMRSWSLNEDINI